MSNITESTSIDLTRDSESQDSIRCLQTSPVNHVSIEIPQNHQQLTMSKLLIVVNWAGEAPVEETEDEQTSAEKHQPYENNFTQTNFPENLVSRNAAA